jgi:hypothetical protein
MVMSAMVLVPPSTRLEIGQEMKAALGSTSVTRMLWSDHRRMYLAAVAPP